MLQRFTLQIHPTFAAKKHSQELLEWFLATINPPSPSHFSITGKSQIHHLIERARLARPGAGIRIARQWLSHHMPCQQLSCCWRAHQPIGTHPSTNIGVFGTIGPNQWPRIRRVAVVASKKKHRNKRPTKRVGVSMGYTPQMASLMWMMIIHWNWGCPLQTTPSEVNRVNEQQASINCRIFCELLYVALQSGPCIRKSSSVRRYTTMTAGA